MEKFDKIMFTLKVQIIQHRGKQNIAFFCPYSSGSELDREIRNLPGRKYSSTKKCWYIPYIDDYQDYITKAFAHIDGLDIVFPNEKNTQTINRNISFTVCHATVYIDKTKGKFYVKHDYNPSLFKKLFAIERAVFG